MQDSYDISITVIIPNLHSPTVDKTIDSILNQKLDLSFEIIVIGLDKYGLLKKFTGRITSIDTSIPVKPGTARNLGVARSNGKYLVFIDSDALAEPNFLQGHINTHNFFENSIIGGGVTFPRKPYLTLCDNIATFHEYMPHLPAGKKRMVPTVNMSVSRIIFNTINGFNDDPAGEDIDFSMQAKNKGFKIFFNPDIKVVHFPQRKKLINLIQHSYRLGLYTKIFKKLINKHPILNLFNSSHLLIIFATPIISLLISLKILFIEHLPIKYWHTLPMIYFLKCVWCFGASKGLFRDSS
jgi:glycosyltransferase involved in cell wall biosynthesis